MLYIQIKDGGRWEMIPESPHRVTVEQLREARAEWQAELEASPGAFGAAHAPQTTARGILERAVPGLLGFDMLALGFAVTATSCRTSEAVGGPWERLA